MVACIYVKPYTHCLLFNALSLICPFTHKQQKIKYKTGDKSLIDNDLNRITTVIHNKEAVLITFVAFYPNLLGFKQKMVTNIFICNQNY
jgi:hypothetical protein